MAKNEDGEFELILGNNQLLSVFFLVVLLLALCFVGGYVVGRNAAPLLTADGPATPPSAPATKPAKVEVATNDTPAPKVIPPIKTAPQAPPEEKAEPPKQEVKQQPPAPKAEAPKAAAKVEPPKPDPAKTAKATLPSIPASVPKGKSSTPAAGRRYLQLAAIDKASAEVQADLIRSRSGLPAIAAPIPDRPDLYRVLVGPINDDAVESTKSKLSSSGFPAKDAISRVF